MHGGGTRGARLAIAFAVGLVVVVAWARVVFAGRTFGAEGYLGEVVPALAYIGERIGGLELPEWWDGVGMGVPFAANPDHPALYPPAWLMALLPDVVGADLLVLVHLALLGIGVALLSRRLGADDRHVIVAGGAAAVSGAATGAIASGTLLALAWAPWVALAGACLAEADDRAARVRAAIGLALCQAAQLHAGPFGHAPATAAVAIVVALAAAPAASRRSLIVWLLVAEAAALLLSAAALVPALQLDLARSALSRPGGGAALSGIVWPGDAPAYLGAPIVLLAALSLRRRALWPVAGIALAAVAVGALRARGHAAPGLVALAALAGVGFTELSEVARRGRSWPRVRAAVEPLVGTLVVGHMIALSWSAAPMVDRAPLEREPSLLAAAPRPAVGPPLRIARPPLPRDDERGPEMAHRTATPNSASRFGFSYVRGSDRAVSERLAQAWRAAALGGERLLDLFAVDLLAVPESVVVAANMPVAGRDPATEIALVQNREKRPRAFVAARWRWYADADASRDDLFPSVVGESYGIALSTVHLEGVGTDGGVERAAPAAPCRIVSYRPERIALDCPRTRPGYAVLLDAWDAGWNARVEGKPAEIERADLVARAVRLGEGQGAVSFRYRAPGLRLGGLIAGLTALNLLVLAVVFRRRA